MRLAGQAGAKHPVFVDGEDVGRTHSLIEFVKAALVVNRVSGAICPSARLPFETPCCPRSNEYSTPARNAMRLAGQAGAKHPVFVDGARGCQATATCIRFRFQGQAPTHSLIEFVKAALDPFHKEHATMIEWYGGRRARSGA